MNHRDSETQRAHRNTLSSKVVGLCREIHIGLASSEAF